MNTNDIDKRIKNLELCILQDKLDLMEVKVMRFRIWWLERLMELGRVA